MAHLDAGAAAPRRPARLRRPYDRARRRPGNPRAAFAGHHPGLACGDHTAPVFEGDTLRSQIELERREPLPGGGGLVHLRSRVSATAAARTTRRGARLAFRRGARVNTPASPRRPARGRGIGLRRRAAGRDDARAARRRRDPLRPDRRRPRRRPLAARADGRSLFWAGLNKGKRSIQLDLHSPEGRELVACPGGRARRGRRDLPDQLPRPRLARLRLPAPAPRRSHHVRADRQPGRLIGGRLHRQPRDGVSMGDGPARPRRSRSTACCPRGTRSWAGWRRPACSPPSATAPAPARARSSGSRSPTSRSRWSATSGVSPRRSSAAATCRKRRQLPLRRLRARLRHQRRAARDGGRAHRPPVDRAAAR